jgi:hypothetical protein
VEDCFSGDRSPGEEKEAMNEDNAIVKREDFMPITKEQALKQYQDLKEFIDAIMKDGVDYGPSFPGDKKKNLLKAGAEKLKARTALDIVSTCTRMTEDWNGKDNGGEPFFFYEYNCTASRYGEVLGNYVAACNSWEEKYRFRLELVKCPGCGHELNVSKKEEGGWFCWAKKGGCGKQFKADDPLITSQPRGKVRNDRIFDQVSTIMQMAQKRAFVGVIRLVTGTSEWFTQDAEDYLPPEHQEGTQEGRSSENGKKEGYDTPRVEKTQPSGSQVPKCPDCGHELTKGGKKGLFCKKASGGCGRDVSQEDLEAHPEQAPDEPEAEEKQVPTARQLIYECLQAAGVERDKMLPFVTAHLGKAPSAATEADYSDLLDLLNGLEKAEKIRAHVAVVLGAKK